MYGVRRFCGIHVIYSGAVIRDDRQGLFYGKFEASRCGTHLLYSGFTSAEVRHRRIFPLESLTRSGNAHIAPLATKPSLPLGFSFFLPLFHRTRPHFSTSPFQNKNRVPARFLFLQHFSFRVYLLGVRSTPERSVSYDKSAPHHTRCYIKEPCQRAKFALPR